MLLLLIQAVLFLLVVGEDDGCKNDRLQELALTQMGARVKRGCDWKYGYQDGPAPALGTIYGELDEDGFVKVEWDTGHLNTYRMGAQNKYDLQIVSSCENKGPQEVSLMKIGTRVKRGCDWDWDDDDDPGLGTIYGELDEDGSVEVEWDTGYRDWYRMGEDNKYDLRFVSKCENKGPQEVALMKIGTRVKRGCDWEYGDQDGPVPGLGTIYEELDEDGWIEVEWDTGYRDSYRMGKENKYDLRVVSECEHGAQEVALMKIGTRVKRGCDWRYGNQDGPAPGLGTIYGELDEDGTVEVEWDTGYRDWYRMGEDDKYDLGFVSKCDNKGPQEVALMKIGTRVKRGCDWKYGYQDGSAPGLGTIHGELDKDGMLPVKWDTGDKHTYRMGKDDKYDLSFVSRCKIKGQEEAVLMVIGARVQRGCDWKYGDADGQAPGLGTIYEEINENGWVSVEWDTGERDSYWMGRDGQYELSFVSKCENKGPQEVALMKIGTRVKRGCDWEYGYQDGPAPGLGTIYGELDEDGWIEVEWDTGDRDPYRMGDDDKYDLRVVSRCINKGPEEAPKMVKGTRVKRGCDWGKEWYDDSGPRGTVLKSLKETKDTSDDGKVIIEWDYRPDEKFAYYMSGGTYRLALA